LTIRNSLSLGIELSGPHRRNRARAGFTTPRIAIALGIIGGVLLCAVWLVGSFIDVSSHSNQETDGANIRTMSIKSILAINGAPLNPAPLAVPSPAGADFCYYTPIMLQEAVFPETMLWPPAPAKRFSFHHFDTNHTMSCGGTVGSAQVSLACGATDGVCDTTKPVLFAVRYNDVANKGGQNHCSDLVMRSSLLKAEPSQIVLTWSGGKQTIYSGNGSTCSAGATCPLPLTAANASIGCNSGDPSAEALTIDWYYALGR
jgi:hypothetical protein